MQNLLRKINARLKSWFLTPDEQRHALAGPAELWKMKRAFQIRFLEGVGLKPDHYLLDIGCGTLRGGIPLIDYLDTGHYFGIEARQDVLEAGKRELYNAGLERKKPHLIAGEANSAIDLKQLFDYIWGFSVLIHMSDEILDQTLLFVRQHLKDTGFFFANVNLGSKPDGRWQGFPLVWRSLDFYKDTCARNRLTIVDLGPLSEWGHNSGVPAQDQQHMLKIWRGSEKPGHL